MAATIPNIPKRKQNLGFDEVKTEVMVYDCDSAMVHIFDPTTGKILRLCDGNHTLNEIAEKVSSDYSIDDESTDVYKHTVKITDKFRVLGLLETST